MNSEHGLKTFLIVLPKGVIELKLIAIFLLLVLTVSAEALYVKSGNNVTIPSGATLDDDVIATGNQISIIGNVNGSIYAAGGSLSISGDITGALTAAGNTVAISGKKNVVTVAGRSIQLSSLAARNIAAAGNDITLDSRSKIERDAYLAANSITTHGAVGRDLWVNGGSVSIGSNVTGNLHATGQRISLLPGAVVKGNVIYSSPNAIRIADSAKVTGKVIRQPYSVKRAGPNPFAAWLLRFIAMWIFGAVLISLFPGWTKAASDQLMSKPGWSFLWGLIIFIVTPIAILIALVTLIGIPLSVAVLAVYILALLLAGIITSVTVGRLIARNASIWLQLLVGLLVLSVIAAIPFLGGLVQFLVILFGLGALALSVRRPADRGQAVRS